MFGCTAIGILVLLSLIPFEIFAVPSGSVDSGNYVANNHDTHVAYYNFNDIYTYEYGDPEDPDLQRYVWDDSGRDKKGLLQEDVSTTQERDSNIDGINAALSFNGEDEYVHVNHSSDFNISSYNFVISALIKTDSEESELTICSKGDFANNGFSFYLGAGLLTFKVWENAASQFIVDSDGDDLRDDEWHYVAVESFEGTLRLYIDPHAGSYGEVEVYSNFPQDPGNNAYPFCIGKGQTDYYDGDIDFIYFYAIETSYLPSPASRNRMWGMENVGYWPMDEGLIESVPEDRNYINDMVRSDFHSYGLAEPGTTAFASSNSVGNSAPGTHCLQMYGEGFVNVDDTGNYLDFDCQSGEDDIYIELWVNIEDVEDDMMLVEKWDWNGESDADGYRLYIYYYGLLGTYDFKFELANSTITTLSLSGITPGYWYHVWAWSDGGAGTMNMYYDSHLQGSSSASTTNSYGIGPTDNDLHFGMGFPTWNDDDNPDWPLVGLLDDVVIGRCYPV